MNIRYFDNSATTQIKEEVLKEMFPYLSVQYGNPSSIYSIGRNAKKAIEEARKRVASLINCKPEEIYFTSCGSESDNTALKGIAYANQNKGKHIITSKIEHPAILHSCQNLENKGFEVTYLDVDKDGFVNLETLEHSIRTDTILISIMFANNEIGTIEPIKEIGKIAKENGIYFHTDAVQAVGNIRIDVQELNIDSLALSGHKFYGPKGIGALYVKSGVHFKKYIDGGHQERNKRAGTENVPAIVGMGKALELAYSDMEEHNKKIKGLRDYYEKRVKEEIDNIQINGNIENRLPGNSNILFENADGEGILLNLDMQGICASSGSACTSGSLNPSHVLLAIGVEQELAKNSLRISMGKYNTKEEVDYLVDNLKQIIDRMRKV